MEHRTIKRKAARRPSFVCRYQKEDIHLLAAAEAAHEDLSGPAHSASRTPGVWQARIRTAVTDLGSHIYNLRRSTPRLAKHIWLRRTSTKQAEWRRWRASGIRSRTQQKPQLGDSPKFMSTPIVFSVMPIVIASVTEYIRLKPRHTAGWQMQSSRCERQPREAVSTAE